MASYGKIYGLFDSAEPEHLRYGGRTTATLPETLKRHIDPYRNAKSKTYRTRWVQSVLKAGRTIGIVLLDEAENEADFNWLERFYIRALRMCKCKITNGSDGGDGGICPTEETSRKLSAARKALPVPAALVARWGTPHREETKRQIGDANRGRKHTSQAKQNMSAGQKRRAAQETTKRWNKGSTGKTFTEEHKNGISRALRGKRKTEEARRHMSDAKRGKKQSAEHNRHISESLRGKPSRNKGHRLTAEQKRKRGKTTAAFWAAMREGQDAERFETVELARAHAETVWATYPTR